VDRRSTRRIKGSIAARRDHASLVAARTWPLAVVALAIVVAACSNGNGGGSGY
jgi:hypothetical protein